MARTLLAHGPGAVSLRLVLRLVAVGREVRARVAQVVHVPPGARVSILSIEAHTHPHPLDPGFLDAAAGGEFVDDRIRLRE